MTQKGIAKYILGLSVYATCFMLHTRYMYVTQLLNINIQKQLKSSSTICIIYKKHTI